MTEPATGGSLAKRPQSHPIVELILSLQFPLKTVLESMKAAMAASGKPADDSPELRQIAARRAELLALSDDELTRIHAQLMAEQKRQEAAREVMVEAGRFYNQPQAQANFDLWLKVDFWTFDDAIALLLGKNPKVVTWNAVDQAVNPKGFFKGPPARSQFLTAYMTLRDLALRSDVMTSGEKLRPTDVVRWAVERLHLQLGAPLRSLLSAPIAQEPDARSAVSPSAPEAAPSDAPILVKAAALRALSNRWPTVESDLRHAERNGLAQAAKAEGRGLWREQDALEWARRNGKLKPSEPHRSLADLPRRIIRSGE